MTFERYWEEKGHLGSSPEDVARLAWDASRNINTGVGVQSLTLDRAGVATSETRSERPWTPSDAADTANDAVAGKFRIEAPRQHSPAAPRCA